MATITIAVVATSLSLLATPASALSKHVYSNSFAGTGPATLGRPGQIAVDETTHDVYVADLENHRIEKFTPAGAFLFMIGKDVNKTAVETAGSTSSQRDLCTAVSGDLCQPGARSATPGGFNNRAAGEPEENGQHGFDTELYLAVDNSGGAYAGMLYVGDAGDERISRFNSSGSLDTSWGDGGQLTGTPATQFNLGGASPGLEGVAVAPDGTVVIAVVFVMLDVSPDGAFLGGNDVSANTTSHAGIAVLDANHAYTNARHNEFRVVHYSFPPGKFAQNSLSTSGFRIIRPPYGKADENSPEGGEFISNIALDQAHRDFFYATKDGMVTHVLPSCLGTSEFAVPPPLGCNLLEVFGGGHLVEPKSLALDASTGTVYVADPGASAVAVFSAVPYLPDAIPSATDITPSGATLSGDLDPAGAGPITGCSFEYGFFEENHSELFESGPLECLPSISAGSPLSSPGSVQATVTGLDYATEYHFHVTAENANGADVSYDQVFTTKPLAPSVADDRVQSVQSDTASLTARINANGGPTTYRVEYVDDEVFQGSGFQEALLSPVLDAGSLKTSKVRTAQLSQLQPGTKYDARLVATNVTGAADGAVHSFTTLPFVKEVLDGCSNAHVRQQTGAAALLDCRAYELASAPDTAGYDVESSTISGQQPFGGYPEAGGKVLYGVHSGGIPGTDHPTNHGLDPYVATRGENGWSTEYVGTPADNPFSAEPFSSTPTGADAALDTFAFGGPHGCSPCFEGGYTGIPVRRPNGDLVQGMAGPDNPGPAASPDGHIATPLSANGEHFIFGSTSRFAEGGNDQSGDVSIYDRNLNTGTTYVVSNAPGAEDFPTPLPCLQGEGKCNSASGDSNGISELAISNDGSNILLGQKVSEDPQGHPYYHLYIDVNDSISSIDITPGVIAEPAGAGFKEGVLFAGMTSDGSKVFFTTSDQLLPGEDTDQSADLYMAEISAHSATLHLISTNSDGTLSNSDSCDPTANSGSFHWNTVAAGEVDCGVLAIGGGAGASAANGSIYFFSPEKLDGSGNGVQDAPNLYLAGPADGYAPHYVTTLESALTGSQPPRKNHRFLQAIDSSSQPRFVAVDNSAGGEGDLYVATAGEAGLVEKFDSQGHLIESWGAAGKISGGGGEAFTEIAGIAVDASGNLDVLEAEPHMLFRFSQEGLFLTNIEIPRGSQLLGLSVDAAGNFFKINGTPTVEEFRPSGEDVGSVSSESFEATGLAIDPSTGDLYVAANGTAIVRYSFNASGEVEQAGGATCVVEPFVGCPPTEEIASGLSGASGLAVDPATHDIYVDQGTQFLQLDSDGNQIGLASGSGILSGSTNLALDSSDDLYASNPGREAVAKFGPLQLLPDPSTDNPLLIDSLSEPSTRHTADFQVTPDGEFAAFGSTLHLAGNGEETAGHSEVYRYGAASGSLACVSCTLTGVSSAGDSFLAKDGLSLISDGRVVFDSFDQLLSADTDGREDAYQWSPTGAGNCDSTSPSYLGAQGGFCLALISAGTSTFDSGLLTATSDGTDVFFFTRDSLAPQDNNGPTMKVYDARAAGGFPYAFPAASCRASDECHGPASALPGPIPTGSEAGTPTGLEQKKPQRCKKGYVRKHGHCVRRHRPHHRHSGHPHKSGGNK